MATYQAIVDAVKFSPNVHVLNNSWGSTNEDGTPGRYSTTVRQAFAYAYKANRTSVVAMGNHQQTNVGVVAFPAGFDNVIAVGATNINDGIANFSARGNHVDMAAPGVGILSTFTNGGYANQDGTSMATPHVSGIASLLKGFNTNLANDDIENILRLSADDVNRIALPGFDAAMGAGRVNAERALNFLRAPFALSQWTSHGGGSVTNSTSNYSVHFVGVTGLSTGNYIVRRHEVQKAVTFPNSFCQVTGAWGRGVATSGWSRANPNYGEGFCRVVPGTLTNTGVTLHTFVYEVVNTLGQSLGWYPTTPANVTFAYTVLGIPTPNYSITGPNTVCSSGANANAAFALQNVPAGAAVTWTATSGLTPSSGSGTSATVSAVSGFSGNGSVTFNISGTCGNTTAKKDFWVSIASKPDLTFYGTINNMVTCAYNTFQVQASTTGNVDPYGWSWTVTGGTLIDGQGSSLVTIQAPGPGQGVYIRVGALNPCGYSYYGRILEAVTEYEGQNCFLELTAVSVSPNPTADYVDIAPNTSLDHNPVRQEHYQVKLYDKYGQQITSASTRQKGEKLRLNVKPYPEGLYFVRVTYSGGVISKQLVIKR